MNEDEQSQRVNNLLTGVASGLKSMKEVRAIYDKQIAFEFNSLNFFRPNENKISQILAFFLDPNSNHAQEAIFLEIFIEELRRLPTNTDGKVLNNVSTKTAKVFLEKHTSENRRIDMVIELETFDKKKFLIGIENKIYDWTKEQKNQVGHYADELLKDSKDNFLLLYLTPHGEGASEESISKEQSVKLENLGNLLNISHDTFIINLFEKFESACQAQNVRAFIKDFLHYLKQQYLGEKIMIESKFTADKILENSENLQAAFDIISAEGDIKTKLLAKFKEEVENSDIVEKGRKAVCVDSYKKITSIYANLISISNDSWSDATIFFQFQSKNSNGLVFGIATKDHYENLKDLKGQLGYPLSSGGSVCFKRSEEFYNWGSNQEPWKAMIKPDKGESEMLKYVKDIILEISEKLDTHFKPKS